jgi:hypothetical protein
MSPRSAALSLAFANVGHLFTHMLMLLYPTVVLALEGRYGLSYGELLALSMPGFVLTASRHCRRAGSATAGAPST